jgi:hypothetical protein
LGVIKKIKIHSQPPFTEPPCHASRPIPTHD